MQLIKKRRVHRLVVVEGEVSTLRLAHPAVSDVVLFAQEEEKRGGKKGRLLGIITLSDVLRYIIGENVVPTESVERLVPPEEDKTPTAPPAEEVAS